MLKHHHFVERNLTLMSVLILITISIGGLVENAMDDLFVQADPWGDHDGLLARYPKAVVGDLDGDPSRLTEMDALVAYLQILGRMVDFADTAVEDLEAMR